jgi:hypothetical protein
MKYVIVFCVALVITCTVPFLTRTVVVDLTPEPELEVEKTLDSEIDRLSIKYSVASSTARAVMKCESQMYGDVINLNRRADGTVWSIDKGHWQINNYYHEARMNQLGLDWNDEWDSLEFGFMLMAEQGLSPWNASRKCWSKLI